MDQVDSEALTADLGKCTKQLAAIAGKNVKFLLSQLKASLFIAEIAIKSIKSFKRIINAFSFSLIFFEQKR